MAYTIDQFGFIGIDQIPVEENDWGALLQALDASDETVIKKDFNVKSASNAAGAIRKAAEALDLKVEVVTKKGTVYIQKL